MNPSSSWNWSSPFSPSMPVTMPFIPVIPPSLLPESVKLNMAVVFNRLLPNVLNHVQDQDLIHGCRLVSKSWRDESTLILRRRKTAKCTFEYYPPGQKFIFQKQKFIARFLNETVDVNLGVNVNLNGKRLAELSQLLSCPFETFPCSWIYFLSGSLNHTESLEFLSVYGEKVKKLTLDFGHNSGLTTGFVGTRIFGLIPNVEILGIPHICPFVPDLSDLPDLPPTQHQHQLKQEQEPKQEDNENQNQNQRPLLPHLNLVCLQSDLKTEDLGLSDASKVLNFLRSPSLAPQLSSLFIRTLELSQQQQQRRQNQNDGISILQTWTCTFNVKCGTLSLQLFYPDKCPTSLIETAAEFNVQAEILHILNGSLKSNRRPSKEHFIRVRRALWRMVENTSDILERFSCSFQCLNLLTRIPFPPGFFQKLRDLSLFDETGGTGETMALEPNSYFRCSSDSSTAQGGDFASDFPGRPLWTDFSTIFPCLKTIDITFSPSCFDVEKWLPFLNPPITISELENPTSTSKLNSTFTIANSSVENLKVSSLFTGSCLTPQILGLLIKWLPNLTEIVIQVPTTLVFMPVLDHNKVSTLEQLLSFLFGIERENRVEMEEQIFVKQEAENERQTESCSSSQGFSQPQAKMSRMMSPLWNWNPAGISTPTPNPGFGLMKDPLVQTIRTLLNLQKLRKLWVTFLQCERRDIFQGCRMEYPSTSTSASASGSGSASLQWNVGDVQSAIALAPQFSNSNSATAASSSPFYYSFSSIPGDFTANNCFLSRIPNRTYIGLTNDFLSLSLSCTKHPI